MKNHIFKFIAGFAIILLSPRVVNAQEGDDFRNSTPEQRALFQTEWMKTELSLDSTVVSTVFSINLKYARENQTLMDSGGSRMQKFREMKANSDNKDSELKNVFTKEQYKLYLQRKDEMKQKMKQKMQERRKK